MKTRLIIILFSVPLFIALGLMNSALLYFQERSEAESALHEQALSAAVTAAEFIRSTSAAERILRDPSRITSIIAAASQIKNLDGFYFINGDGEATALSPASNPWGLDSLSQPTAPTVTPFALDASTHPYIIALAPAGPESFIAVRLDAAPMVAQLAVLRRNTLLIICIAGVIGALLAWQVAHRIVRDLHQNRGAMAALEAGENISVKRAFTIREARDLADAVRLMGASQQAATKRLELESSRRDHQRSPNSSAVKYSQSEFKPVSVHLAGTDIAVRFMGETPAGSFFAVCADKDRGVVVVGECSAKTAPDALALALAARRFLQNHLLDSDINERLKLAKTAYSITSLEYIIQLANVPSTPDIRLLALTDAGIRRQAKHFSGIDPNAAPIEVLNGIEALLKPNGVFAAIKQNKA
ncbi:MAG: hypothetical protein AAGC95_15390 [Pseudomonadota bacterium]